MLNRANISRLGRVLFLGLVSGLLAACGGGGGSDSQTTNTSTTNNNDGVAKVTFVYRAQVAPDTAIQNAFPGCVSGVGATHIHISWRSFARFNLSPVGSSQWTRTFGDVPTKSLQSIRISDANSCDLNRTGATTTNVFANDVELTNIVDTPGTGIEPGLSFTVREDGTVTP
ncbi:MAG: hypothetical protein V3T39_00575 [Gammaproteobacteria bacterium]